MKIRFSASIALFAFFCQADELEFGEERAQKLEPVEVTAYKFASLSLDTPIDSTFLNEAEISESGSQTIPELLQKKANVRMLSSGASADSPLAMRGFGDNSQQRILILVDGQRYNRPDMANPSWLSIPLATVENIEVLRGAQSAIYGNNAVAGVVKISTKKGGNANALNVDGMYGSYGTYVADVSFSGAEGKWSFFGDLNRYATEGYADNSSAWSNVGSASLSYDFNENNSLRFSGNYGESETNYPTPLTYKQMLNGDTNTGLNFKYRNNTGIFSAALQSSSAFGNSEIPFALNFRDRTIGDQNSSKINNQWEYAFNPRMEIKTFEAWTIYFGVDFDYADIFYSFYRDETYAKNFLREHADARRSDIGAYFGADYSATEKLSFSAAGRAEVSLTEVKYVRYNPPVYPGEAVSIAHHFDDSNWQSGFAGSFGANCKFTKNMSAYFRMDQIYRYPTVDEISRYQAISGMVMDFNPDLKPETGQNFEIGCKYESENFQANISCYALLMYNEIMYAKAQNAVVATNINAPDTLRLGVDIRLSYNGKYWGVFTGGGFVDARFIQGENEGNKIPLVPEFTGYAGIDLKPHERITFTAQANYSTSQYEGNDYANNQLLIPSYVTADFRVNIRLCNYASMYLAVENAFDEHYATMAFAGAYYPSMGRMFKLGLNMRY